MPFSPSHLVLRCLAVFAFCWIIARACIQSVVIDEADSYLFFAAGPWPGTTFFPSSGNHVLNTLLVRCITSAFGLSEITLRLPAIIGAAIYIWCSAGLSLLLTNRKLLQWLLFVCLVCNPFVLDYLVAARGYSIAMGFLMAAILILARAIMQEFLSTAPPPQSNGAVFARRFSSLSHSVQTSRSLLWMRRRSSYSLFGPRIVCREAGLDWPPHASCQGLLWPP